MTLQRSYADDIPLMSWLNDYIWPFESRQTPDDVALGMTLGIVEMLLGGVTSFVDMYYFRIAVWRLPSGSASASCWAATISIRTSTRFSRRWSGPSGWLLRAAGGCGSPGAHSPYTVSPENSWGQELADEYGLGLMTHRRDA